MKTKITTRCVGHELSTGDFIKLNSIYGDRFFFIIDEYCSGLLSISQVYDIFRYRNFPNEQNTIIGLA